LNTVIADKTLTIRSRDPNNPAIAAGTIIDGRNNQNCRAFIIGPAENTCVTLAGLTIINNHHGAQGGAISCENAVLDVINCTFIGNVADSKGGAIHCANSRARFEGCAFLKNTSQSIHGGAIFGRASWLDFVACSFEGNTGGALECYDSDLTLVGCAFLQNASLDGGAIHCRRDVNPAVPTRLTLTKCTFTANAASSSGGALCLYSVQGVFRACTFTTNAAGQDGGAIHNYRSSPAVDNCVFVGNTAAGIGGALHNLVNSNPDIIHCTFAANKAASGGAVASRGDSDPFVSHSILWGNTAAQGMSLHVGRYQWNLVQAAKATVEYSNVEGGRKSVSVESDGELNWAAGNISVDPRFTGPNRADYHLSPDSPCIDAGDPEYVPDPNETDLDGRARRLGAAVDIGAYEFQGLGPVYQFWSPVTKRRFYTIKPSERDSLISRPKVWRYEDVAYYAFYLPIDKNLLPVYRFWSGKLRTHFWTISEGERAKLIKEKSAVWAYEGVAFYAYPKGRQPLGTMPVYQFWSGKLGYHFYTMDEEEKDKLIRDQPQTWTFEGPGWYVYAKPYQPPKAAYAFTGGAQEAWYAFTLGASVDGREAQITSAEVRLPPSSTLMRMTIDFDRFGTTLDGFHVLTTPIEHKATITSSTGTKIPLVLSMQASFDVSTPQGPFAVDPTTRVFADFTRAAENIVVKDATARYDGEVRFGKEVKTFHREEVAARFELKSSGTFEAVNLLPEGIYARLPFTFQWHRQYVQDLLAEGFVDGRLVQIYVTNVYVGTQGLWRGGIVK
jgi:predicted outer membrane repeat protein